MNPCKTPTIFCFTLLNLVHPGRKGITLTHNSHKSCDILMWIQDLFRLLLEMSKCLELQMNLA